MLTKLKVWFTNLATWIKIVSGLFAFVGSMYGAIVIYNSWIIKRHDSQIELIRADERRDQEFKDLKSIFDISMKSVVDSLTELSKEVRVVRKEVRTNTKATNSAINSLSNHYRIDKRIDELFQLMQDQRDNEKKNSSWLTPYGSN